ncbi:hypothetical protein [Cystobacter ferrugineus]|uniref:Uncharacterized protein n=1 Tax=Cystobacter ferrugineus TaxID=83449 RepID=A0A1L9BK56_9BACT|nr:hypothetical protein [Cystobacter ferrugineus]OJH42651.1 hypothetical protein BON30_05570 [Cystobacter ferrugineus]
MSRLLSCMVVGVCLLGAAPVGADAPKKDEAPVQVKSFTELRKARPGRVFELHVAPAGVLADSPGLIYAEPCDPKDPAIRARTGVVGTVEVEDVPLAKATEMNARNGEEFSKRTAITCYRVIARLKSNQKGWTKLAFVSAEPSGSRPYDERLNPARGD